MHRLSPRRFSRVLGTCALTAGMTLHVPLAVSAQPMEARQQAVRTNLLVPAAGEPGNDPAARLQVPDGFTVSVVARDLGGTRMMAVDDAGSVYVTRPDSGDVLAFTLQGAGAPNRRTVVRNLEGVHGIAVHGESMYLVTEREIYRRRLDAGVNDSLQRIASDLPDAGQHPNRTIAIGPDSLLYVSVGSTCNRCVEPREESATMLRMKLDGSEREVFARGLRNTIGFDWHPDTRAMWGMDHGSDWAGDDVPPEELNELQSGAHYGWPFCHSDRLVDSLSNKAPDGTTAEAFCAASAPPALMYQAHSSPLAFQFYRGDAFPARFRDGAFVTMRGSWNRQPPSGYKVVYVRFENARPVGFEDFMTGFLSEDGRTHFGRIAGLVVSRDGSLLVADDSNGILYKITARE
jgi:glucose/arabinose dehydrogenase